MSGLLCSLSHNGPKSEIVSAQTYRPDAKSLSTLGMRCFGFAPLLLPADRDFMALFHGIDEHVPASALQFGVRVLDRLLSSC